MMFRKCSIEVNEDNIQLFRVRIEDHETYLKTCCIGQERFAKGLLELNQKIVSDYENGTTTDFIEME